MGRISILLVALSLVINYCLPLVQASIAIQDYSRRRNLSLEFPKNYQWYFGEHIISLGSTNVDFRYATSFVAETRDSSFINGTMYLCNEVLHFQPVPPNNCTNVFSFDMQTALISVVESDCERNIEATKTDLHLQSGFYNHTSNTLTFDFHSHFPPASGPILFHPTYAHPIACPSA